MKTRTILIWVIALFAVDQVIKIVIDRYFLDVNFDILPPLFYFRPYFNDEYSWVNGLFRLGMGFWAHIALFLLVAVIFVVLYDSLKTASGNSKTVNIAFIFGFAGFLSSLVCTVFWDGCLDYIYLKPLFIFDLKDLYIDCFVIIFLLYYFKNRKYLSTFKFRDINQHIKNRFALIINRKSKIKNGI